MPTTRTVCTASVGADDHHCTLYAVMGSPPRYVGEYHDRMSAVSLTTSMDGFVGCVSSTPVVTTRYGESCTCLDAL